MSTTITWTDCIDETWNAVKNIRVGGIPEFPKAPERYVLVSQQDQPLLRIDVHRNSEESFLFNEAKIWHGFVVIGWGHRVYLIRLDSYAATIHPLDSYFSGLYADDNNLIVASGERVYRIATDGTIGWRSDVLGIDGVIIHNIEEGTIRGSGEWDPPGGWQPFQISLESGQPIQQL